MEHKVCVNGYSAITDCYSDVCSIKLFQNNCSGTLNIPSVINVESTSYKVSHIMKNAFLNCNDLVAVILPISVEKIDFGAFSGCKKLEKIEIQNQKCDVASYAVINCPKAKIYKDNVLVETDDSVVGHVSNIEDKMDWIAAIVDRTNDSTDLKKDVKTIKYCVEFMAATLAISLFLGFLFAFGSSIR